MRPRQILGIVILIGAMLFATMGYTSAAPGAQGQQSTVGIFGTVTAIVGGTIILDSGDVVAADENTLYAVPGVDSPTLANISIGGRVGIVAAELEDGVLLAQSVMLIPGEPVTTTHLVGVVTSVEDGLIILTDDEGNTFSVEVPEGVVVGVGEYLTIVSSLVATPQGDEGDRGKPLKPRALATINDVVDRLVNDIQQAVGRAQERLQALLERNGDQYVTALARARERAAEAAQDALDNALERATTDLGEIHRQAGVRGPFVRVTGFITVLSLEDGVGTVTIDSVHDGDVTLDVTSDTQLEDPISEGDFVQAKYNRDKVAREIELESDELTFQGTVTSFSDTELTLRSGTTFAINEETEVEGTLSEDARVKVDALPLGGQLVAQEIKVLRGNQGQTPRAVDRLGEGEEEDADREVDLKGKVTALTETTLEVNGVLVHIAADTKIEGDLALDVSVKVKATVDGDTVTALKIEVRGRVRGVEAEGVETQEEDAEAGFEFKGTITALSETSLEVDGFGPILITSDTEIKGTPFLGAQVKVEATASTDGAPVATEIKIDDEVKLRGVVASLTDTEVVLENGTTLAIDEDTDIEGALSEGAIVTIEAEVSPDGTLAATEIEVKGRQTVAHVDADEADSQGNNRQADGNDGSEGRDRGQGGERGNSEDGRGNNQNHDEAGDEDGESQDGDEQADDGDVDEADDQTGDDQGSEGRDRGQGGERGNSEDGRGNNQGHEDDDDESQEDQGPEVGDEDSEAGGRTRSGDQGTT
ncbi:MAG: hypothetical protein HYX93_07210 [Chloroflexi bacterium]|nr:hypothetical protein [Chloroflexota bacterium]